MADTTSHLIYCKAHSLNGNLYVPGDTLLLKWLIHFLQQQRRRQQGYKVEADFAIKYINVHVCESMVQTCIDVGPGFTVGCKKSMPEDCTKVDLPCSKCNIITRSGLTTLCAWMVLTCHEQSLDYGYNHLLGYKETCFKACAEVSPWTKFVTTHLLSVLDNGNETGLVVQVLQYLEEKLNSKHTAAAYKRNYFKNKDEGSLKYFYSQLNALEKKEQYLTSHLPNLVDILSYVTVQVLVSRYTDGILKQFPHVRNWCNLMNHLPGVSHATEHCGISTTSSIDHMTIDLSKLSLINDNAYQPSNGISEKMCVSRDVDVVAKLKKHFKQEPLAVEVVGLNWENLPSELDPGGGGKLPLKRATKKRQQLENMYFHVKRCLEYGKVKTAVDFCAGGGHVGLLVAYLHPDIQVHLVENKVESLANASHRIHQLQLCNVKMFQCNLTQYHSEFDLGMSLHACGVATDLVIDQCLQSIASVVVCPCCYGTIHASTSLQLPRSEEFRLIANKEEMLTIRHSSDKTEIGIDQQSIGMTCMALSDLDRKLYINGHHGYESTNIYMMSPSTCSPKNLIIVGDAEAVVLGT